MSPFSVNPRDVLCFVLAGGRGNRLDPLTLERSKPSVPFGGKYRIIDFTLSNCINSGIRKILIATQYKAQSLNRHVRMGWNVVNHELGEFIDVLPPQKRTGEHWYLGTADAVWQNLYALERENARWVIVLAGDHIYRMDYGKMLDAHISRGAQLTLGAIEVPVGHSSRYGVLETEPDGRVTLWSSTQNPHYLHRALTKALEMPAARIRVIACPNGGGFGGKCDPFNHEIVVTRASLLLGRPVKICLTREEVFYCHRGRHPTIMKLRTGVNRDGSLAGMRLETLLDGGAYGSHGIASTFYSAVLQPLPYRLPRYSFGACRVFTNKPPCGPKRGHGTPQPRFGQEVQLDKIAEKLQMDPAELRLNMLAPADSLTCNYLTIGAIGMRECIEKVVDSAGWNRKYRQLPAGRGVGLACGAYMSGAGTAIYWNKMPHSGVQLKLDRSGGVTVYCGCTDVGQGSDDVLVSLVAEVLGISPLDVRCVTGDTALTPVDLGSYSSRVTLMMGNAAIAAASRAADRVGAAAAARLDCPQSRVCFGDGRVFDASDPENGLSFQEAVICAEEAHGTIATAGSYTPPRQAGRYPGAGVGPSPTYSYSASVAEVEVDSETGAVAVARVYIAHDIGRSLNPVSVRGQVIGGVYMGIGEALMEEQALTRLPPRLSGALVHRGPSVLDYKTLTANDMPEVFVDIVESADPNGPFGAKEVGQGPLLPVVPAIANAVYDAVGVRIDEVPISADKVLRALEKKAAGKEPRTGPGAFPDIAWPDPVYVVPPGEGGDGKASAMPRRRHAAKMHRMDKVGRSGS